MSMSGSTTTTTTPQIPPDLLNLLNTRSAGVAQNIPALSNLFAALQSGDTGALAPYTRGQIPGVELAGQQRRSQLLESDRTAGGGALATGLAQSATGTELTRAGQESQFAGHLLASLARMVGQQQYPTGGTRTDTSQPGVLDYINALANAGQGLGWQVGRDRGGAEQFNSPPFSDPRYSPDNPAPFYQTGQDAPLVQPARSAY